MCPHELLGGAISSILAAQFVVQIDQEIGVQQKHHERNFL
jgi:hypothetical protein